jgi:hypothetical protein
MWASLGLLLVKFDHGAVAGWPGRFIRVATATHTPADPAGAPHHRNHVRRSIRIVQYRVVGHADLASKAKPATLLKRK